MKKLYDNHINASYCIRKMDLFGLITPKVAENLTKEAADKLKTEMQSKSFEETGCVFPMFFVSEI
jgi:hypothetical protein